MWLAKFGLVVVAVYVGVIAMMYAAQTWLLFPTQLAAPFGPPLPATAARLEIETPDRERLQGAIVPPLRARGDDTLLVLGFGGNAWNAESLAAYLHGLFPDATVAAFHYRGYRPSTGRPSAAALLEDSPLVHDHVLRRVGSARVVAVGLSIGAGVAAHLAKHRPLAGLILVSPFDSLKALAREHYPWAPVGWLMRHHMPVVEFVRGSATPTALIAAERDTIVPPRRTEAVRRAIRDLVLDRTISGADHNDLYHHPAFRAAMSEALMRIEARSGGARPGGGP